MRLATWNVNSLKTRLERVLAWTERHQPDVLCLQETKLTDAQAPTMGFHALGYELVHHGPGRWNGVAIASRIGISDVIAGMPTPAGCARRHARLTARASRRRQAARVGDGRHRAAVPSRAGLLLVVGLPRGPL